LELVVGRERTACDEQQHYQPTSDKNSNRELRQVICDGIDRNNKVIGPEIDGVNDKQLIRVVSLDHSIKLYQNYITFNMDKTMLEGLLNPVMRLLCNEEPKG